MVSIDECSTESCISPMVKSNLCKWSKTRKLIIAFHYNKRKVSQLTVLLAFSFISFAFLLSVYPLFLALFLRFFRFFFSVFLNFDFNFSAAKLFAIFINHHSFAEQFIAVNPFYFHHNHQHGGSYCRLAGLPFDVCSFTLILFFLFFFFVGFCLIRRRIVLHS